MTKDQVFAKAVEILDASEETKGLRVCLDRMDEALKHPNLYEAAQILVDDSLYWAGYFC